jgi:hypothetical protein
MNPQPERGIALVLALFLMSAMSVLAASLMFLSQTETYASMNYRMMSQARYAAEAAVQRASNFLLDPTQYAMPGSPGDPLSGYDRSGSPVKYNGQPVVLSAVASQAANYPVAAVQTAFSNAAKGTLTAGNAALSYSAYATLLSMQAFDSYGGGPAVVQTWQVTATGSLAGPRNATVEVVAMVEMPKVPANPYAAFATDGGCGALDFQGNVTINSYDSSVGPPTGAGNSTTTTGGNVGTNGNLAIGGSVDVQGNLYTPRTGVGNCTDGAVTALTETGQATVEGSVVPLPATVSFPTPSFSATPPTNQVTVNAALVANPATACSSLGLTLGTWPVGNCTVVGTIVTVDGHGSDITLPSVNVASGYTLAITGATSPGQVVNINSLTGSGELDINANMVTNNNESVILKVAGRNPDGSEMAAPVDLSTMAWKQNAATTKYDASTVQIVYGGSGEIAMQGGNQQSAATVYAPNASFRLKGTQDWFGSILASTITNEGNASIHYDRRLTRDFYVVGHPMASTFSWKRY